MAYDNDDNDNPGGMQCMGDDGDGDYGDDGGDYEEGGGDESSSGGENYEEEEGAEGSEGDYEEGEYAEEDDAFGSRDDFENIDDAWFEEDTGDWSDDDYNELAGGLFGDNEYYGDTADQQYEDEGYELIEDDAEYRDELAQVAPGGFNHMRFYNQNGSIVPRGFLTLAMLALLRNKFPNLNAGLLNVILPDELFKKGRTQPQALPSELRNVDPHDTVDLRKYCSPVGDQGQTGRCKAYSLTHAWELLLWTQKQQEATLSCSYTMMQNQKVDGTFTDFEAAYRAEDGTQMGPEHAAALARTGICSESLWPNDRPRPATAQKDLDADAAKNRIAVKALPIALDDVKKVLSQGYPVSFAMATGMAFQSIGRDGVYHIVEEPEGMHGGHAMLIVGYYSNFFIVKNSWGADWGDQGYCYIPKKVLAEAGWEFIAIIPA